MPETLNPPKLYARLPGDRVVNHWHGVQFLTENRVREYRERDSADGEVTVVALSDPALQDKYWLCANWEILSTTEILERFAKGTPVMGTPGRTTPAMTPPTAPTPHGKLRGRIYEMKQERGSSCDG